MMKRNQNNQFQKNEQSRQQKQNPQQGEEFGLEQDFQQAQKQKVEERQQNPFAKRNNQNNKR